MKRKEVIETTDRVYTGHIELETLVNTIYNHLFLFWNEWQNEYRAYRAKVRRRKDHKNLDPSEYESAYEEFVSHQYTYARTPRHLWKFIWQCIIRLQYDLSDIDNFITHIDKSIWDQGFHLTEDLAYDGMNGKNYSTVKFHPEWTRNELTKIIRQVPFTFTMYSPGSASNGLYCVRVTTGNAQATYMYVDFLKCLFEDQFESGDICYPGTPSAMTSFRSKKRKELRAETTWTFTEVAYQTCLRLFEWDIQMPSEWYKTVRRLCENLLVSDLVSICMQYI